MMPVALIGVLVLFLSAACAEEDERLAIVRLNLEVEDGQLMGNVTSEGIFSERIVGTIQSGLPAVVEFFYHLMESSGSPVEDGMHSYSLEYDVWEDIYFLSTKDSTVSLPSLEAMRSMVEHTMGIPLFPAGKMLPQRTYFVQMRVAVNPLKGTDGNEMTGWVMQNVQGQGSSWREQVLNVNDLIEHFFSKDEGSPTMSDWFKSAAISPDGLPAGSGEEH
jgi:hypothetical protein